MLNGKKVLLIITGGIAAYKSLELVRKLKEKGADVIPVMTKAAENFVTPMSVSALAQEKVYNLSLIHISEPTRPERIWV